MTRILLIISIFNFMWNTFGYMKCDYSHGEQESYSIESISMPGHCHHPKEDKNSDHHEDSSCSDCSHRCSSHTLIIKKMVQNIDSVELIGNIDVIWMNRYIGPDLFALKRPPRIS